MSQQYQAYLIRFQRSEAQAHWRVYVENAETGEVFRFATEGELLRFLRQALTIAPASTVHPLEDNDVYSI